MDTFLRMFLRSSAGEVELDTVKAPGTSYSVLDGARGLGLPQRSIETAPLPSANGSVVQSQRFDESEMFLPTAVRAPSPSEAAQKTRDLENVLQVASDDPVELVVEAPELGTVRRRFVYYTEGLEGAIGGTDSYLTWRHFPLKFLAPDPMWYGQERVLTQKVDAGRKPFLTAASTGATVPFFPVVLASSTVDGAYELDIQGDAAAWPVWEITGPGEDLLIENIATGDRIFIRGEFTEPVTVDARPTVADIYSGTQVDGELWKRVNKDVKLFPLRPGVNKVKITMINARPDSQVELTYSETWLAGW